MIDLLDMGKHSVFVWTSYGTVAVTLVILALRSFTGIKASTREIERLKPARRAQATEEKHP